MKRIITESIYDEQGRVIKVITTEEDYSDLTYTPYTFPYNPLQRPSAAPYTPSLNDVIYAQQPPKALRAQFWAKQRGILRDKTHI